MEKEFVRKLAETPLGMAVRSSLFAKHSPLIGSMELLDTRGHSQKIVKHVVRIQEYLVTVPKNFFCNA